MITNNIGNTGAGVYQTGGRVENCLIARNKNVHNDRTLPGNGAGVYLSGGELVNCTIAGNEAPAEYGLGGGLYADNASPRIINCIIRGNKAPHDATIGSPDVTWGGKCKPEEVFFHCALPIPLGVAPVTAAPAFMDIAKDDFTLSLASPCIDAGSMTNTLPSSATDLAGNPRTIGGTIDIGCHETDNSAVSCAISIDREEILLGGTACLSPVLWHLPEGASATYAWEVTGNGTTLASSDEIFNARPPACGDYDVKLTVSYDGQTLSETRKGLLHVAPATLYVDAANGAAAAYPFDTPETATPSLHDAIAAAGDGSVIDVAEGRHILPETLVIEKGVRLQGAGRDKAIIALAPNAPATRARVLIVNHADATVSDVTLTGGRYGVYSKAGATGLGSGVKIGRHGGTITRCRITGNRANSYYQRGGGIALDSEKGLLTHSVIDDNSNIYRKDTRECGGGVYVKAGLVENCLVYGNRSHYGGGVSITGTGRIRNCTIANNLAEYLAGGIYWENGGAEVVNCLFVGNQADQDASRGAPEWRSQTENATQFGKIAAAFSHCAFTCGTATDESSILTAVPFISAETHDYHLVPGSAPADAGIAYEGLPETDFDGNPRLSGAAPDIGCYELDASAFNCGFDAAKREFFDDEPCRLTATLENAPAGASPLFQWVFTDHLGQSFTLEGETIDQTIPAGLYRVELTASVPSGATSSLAREKYLLVAPRTFHVLAAAENPTMAYPYDTWETATTNVFDLAGFTIDHSKIAFSEGTHVITNSLRVDTPIVLEGRGMDKSVIKLSEKAPADRVIFINHEEALVDALTVTGGRLNIYGPDYGVGIWIGVRGGTVSRCRITGNASRNYYQSGGGVALTGEKAHLTHSIIDNNSVVHREIAQFAGGVYASAGVVDNCLVTSNTAPLGAGIAAAGTGLFRNCTVVHNRTVLTPEQPKGGHGGGVLLRAGGTIENTIFAFNTAIDGDTTTGAPEWYKENSTAAKDATRFVRCAWPEALPTNALISADSIHCDPLFQDAATFDFRLRADSPCRNTGFYEGDWATTDLAGKPRVEGRGIDIGAYECDIRRAMILMLR